MVVYEVRAGRVEDAQNAPGEVIGYIPERKGWDAGRRCP